MSSNFAPVNYPPTRKDDEIVNDYHGTLIADPYRWLEDDNAEDTKAWVKAQNKVTFNYLKQIPFRKNIEERLTELINYPRLSAPFRVGKYYFFAKNSGLQNQAVIYHQEGLDGKPRVFIDPNILSADGTTSITLLGASKDKKYMAYSRSEAGSDWQKIYVRHIATNTDLEDELQWVKFSGAGWFGDGFFYSRYPAPAAGDELKGNNQYHSIYYHELGTSQSEDVLIYQDQDHPNYYHYGGTTEEEDYFVMYAAPGTDGYSTYYLPLTAGKTPAATEMVELFGGTEYKSRVVYTEKNQFWVVTNISAPNYRLVNIHLDRPAQDNWVEILSETDNLLQSVGSGGGYLFANYLEKATDRYYQMRPDGSDRRAISLPGLGSAGGFGGEKDDEEIFYIFTSFTYPSTIFRYEIETGKSTPFFKPDLQFDPSEFEEKQLIYQSKDGTDISMFIVHRKGLELDGSHPTFLYGYGGFNVSLSPSFSAMRIAFLEKGGVFAMPNLRGGGEYGEAWHQAGMLKQKQNVFDDFIAAAEYLISVGYTSPEKLGIAGGSNGGLLVGAVMTQRPDLFAVALPAVGVMDMLRYHKFTVGKGWIPEYGSSEDPEMFPILLDYSPLHNLREGVEYPATMITTADHDDRVVPAHSFKFAARLQEVQAGRNPVLIRIETDAGHGAGKPISKVIEEQADLWSFLFWCTRSHFSVG